MNKFENVKWDSVLATLCPRADKRVITNLSCLIPDLFLKYDITTPLRWSHFLAQAAHETDGLRHMVERWGPTPAQKKYENNRRLGNIYTGDGIMFKGRGIFQLTGRHNYEKMSQRINIDLVSMPSRAADQSVALLIACEYWREHNLNSYADNDDIVSITKAINGWTTGIKSRRFYLNLLKKIFDIKDEDETKSILRSKQANASLVIGGASILGILNDVTNNASSVGSVASSFSGGNTTVNIIILCVILIASFTIWYFRKKHLDEEGI